MTCPTSGPQKRLTVAEGKKLSERVLNENVQTGDKWCLIVHSWWTRFMSAVEEGASSDTLQLPAISNEEIVCTASDKGEEYELKPNLTESIDYVVVPEKVFDTLRGAFGVALMKRDVLKRIVVESTLVQLEGPIVEVYPLEVKLAKYSKPDDVVTLKVSRASSLEDVQNQALEALKIPERARRTVQFLIKNDYGKIEAVSESALSSIFTTNTVVYVDESGAASSVTDRQLISAADVANGNNRRAYQPSYYSSREQLGLCGLQNLGNTCFMNSALQCLSNTPELTQYFLSGKYEGEINTTNVLGTGGKLVKAYAEMLQEMWSGKLSSIRPFKLKNVIGNHTPRFNGYAQQDSQELTSFLLDGLHEDLNRVINKPYIEEKESDGRDDALVADEAWQDYKLRNDSVIVDLLHGQLKSKLVCPVCDKISIKFDPFCFLPIPVPMKDRSIKSQVTLVRAKSNGKWAKFVITHTNKTTVREAASAIKENLKGQIATNARIVLLTHHGLVPMDDDALLNPIGPYSSFYNSSKNFYAYVLSPGQGGFLVVQNINAHYMEKSLGAPLVLDLPPKLSRQVVLEQIVPIVSEMLWKDELPSAGDEKEERLRSLRSSQQHQTEESVQKPEEILLSVNDHTARSIVLHDTDEEYQPEETKPVLYLKLKWTNSSQFMPVNFSEFIDREINMVSSLKTSYALKECIDMFTSEEQLDENDSWYCPRCKKHQRAFKKLDMWSLPKILIIQLKRFQYSRFNRDKISTPIEIPVRGLDLSDKIADPRVKQQKHSTVYDLIAMSNHMGGLGSGHYTATALNNGQWCEFNDSSAYKGRQLEDMELSKEAYILFYRRRNAPEGAEPAVRTISTRSSTAHDAQQLNNRVGSPPSLHHPSANIGGSNNQRGRKGGGYGDRMDVD